MYSVLEVFGPVEGWNTAEQKKEFAEGVLVHCTVGVVQDIVENPGRAGNVHLASQVGHVQVLVSELVGRELKVVVANLPWRSEFSAVKLACV